jgi:hypothetical protein
MKKTPVQEFKKWFDENKSSALNHDINKKLTELVEKEKRHIEAAFTNGYLRCSQRIGETGEEYYEEIYNGIKPKVKKYKVTLSGHSAKDNKK